MKLIPTSAVFSDKGPDSSVSSDAVFADDDYGVYAVADGQGYIEGMRPPAEIFVEVVKTHVALLARAFADVEPTDPDPYRVRKAVVVLFSKASAAIRREYGLGPGEEGPIASATLITVGKGHAVVGHVGLTRGILLRWDKLTGLSREHSIARRMKNDGEDVPDDSPLHSVLAQGLGQQERLKVDVSPLRLQDGDCLALMTDGIHGVVEDAEVRDCHASVYSTEQLAKAFAGLAARRTKDDRSCVVIDVEDEDARLEEDDEDAE